MKAGNNELLSNRGGDRTTASSLHLSTEIVDFIKEFRVEDSHYGRTNVREGTVFLQPELTITKLHSLFEERYPEKEVKYWRFYGAFRKYETFKFKKPNVDVCIKCDRLQNTIRNTTSTAQAEAKKELTMHQKNAKEFYDLIVKLKNEKKEVICFDLQKQLPIPKHNSSQTYYLPKIWLYNLGFVNHPTPREDNCSIFQWTSINFSKSPQIVGAGLFRYLMDHRFEKEVYLFADNCPSQNKNYYMLTMLLLLSKKLQIKITQVFPVVGHSYMSVDRLFGRIEKTLNRETTLLVPNDYNSHIEKHAIMHCIESGSYITKVSGDLRHVMRKHKNFTISKYKTFVFENGKVSVSTKYNEELQEFDYTSVLNKYKFVKGKVTKRNDIKILEHVAAIKKFFVNSCLEDQENVRSYWFGN
jgi:hypothetical protein